MFLIRLHLISTLKIINCIRFVDIMSSKLLTSLICDLQLALHLLNNREPRKSLFSIMYISFHSAISIFPLLSTAKILISSLEFRSKHKPLQLRYYRDLLLHYSHFAPQNPVIS